MLLHINDKFTMGKLKIIFLIVKYIFNQPSLSISLCMLMCEADLAISV